MGKTGVQIQIQGPNDEIKDYIKDHSQKKNIKSND